jgi:hypothetical protein
MRHSAFGKQSLSSTLTMITAPTLFGAFLVLLWALCSPVSALVQSLVQTTDAL